MSGGRSILSWFGSLCFHGLLFGLIAWHEQRRDEPILLSPLEPDHWIGSFELADSSEEQNHAESPDNANEETKHEALAASSEAAAPSETVQEDAPIPPATEPPSAAVKTPTPKQLPNSPPQGDASALNADKNLSKPTAASAATTSSSQAAPSTERTPSSAASSSTSGGAEDLPPGTRYLGTAITRAIPLVLSVSKEWDELPVKTVLKLPLLLAVDESAKVVDLTANDPTEAPWLKELRRRLLGSLGFGNFAFDRLSSEPSEERLLLELRIVERHTESFDSQSQFSLKYRAPSEGQEGMAAFRTAQGTLVEASVKIFAGP